jgi:hypothetical protein
MARVYGSRDHGWLSIHGGLTTMGRCSRFEAREVIVIARRERERRSLGFSPMSPLGGGAMKMTSRRHSTEATSGTPMGRWFWARKGEIEAGGGCGG